MPQFKITITNDHFQASSEVDVADFALARGQGLRGAIEIGMEQVIGGEHFFGAEVVVSSDGGSQRYVVSVGASKLI